MIPLADIGEFNEDDVTDASSSLVCETSNINTQCCRQSDGANIGEWFYPDGSIVPRHANIHGPDGTDLSNISRSGFTHQVRLNRHHEEAFSPAGVYECRVPDSNGVLQVAPIILSKCSDLGYTTYYTYCTHSILGTCAYVYYLGRK